MAAAQPTKRQRSASSQVRAFFGLKVACGFALLSPRKKGNSPPLVSGTDRGKVRRRGRFRKANFGVSLRGEDTNHSSDCRNYRHDKGKFTGVAAEEAILMMDFQ